MAVYDAVRSTILIKIISGSLRTVINLWCAKIVGIAMILTLKPMIRSYMGITVNFVKKSVIVNITSRGNRRETSALNTILPELDLLYTIIVPMMYIIRKDFYSQLNNNSTPH